MTMQQINNNPQTPLEKLISDKRRIKRQCIIQKQKLNDDFSYIQEKKARKSKIKPYERVAISWPLLSYVLNFKSSSFNST